MQEDNQHQVQDLQGSEGEGEQEDYYGNFARRVYFLAEEEGWDKKKTMSYFNDRQAFEKVYANWQKKQLGIEDKIPNCVKRLMEDSQSRTEQKMRDERAKLERDAMEEERILMESKMIQQARRRQHGSRKFSKFMEDQITFQMRRQEKLKRAMYEESAKATYTPKISERSRYMIQEKAALTNPELALPIHKRDNYESNAMPQVVSEDPRNDVVSPQFRRRPKTGVIQPTFHPQISKGTQEIIDQKRKKSGFNNLVDDADRRQKQGKKIRMPKPKPEAEQSVMSSQAAQPKGNSSSELLMKRFEKDLYEVLRQFSLDEDTRISEVTMTAIMSHMGFIQDNNNGDLDAAQTIWQHLQPVYQAEDLIIGEDGQEVVDNGERVVVAHLRVLMAAILGFQTGTQAKVSNPEPAVIGTIDERSGDYMLSSLEVAKVHKRYKELSQRRTDHVLMMRRERQEERLAAQQDDQPKQPIVNARSQKIFESMVAKRKIDLGPMGTHQDYLINRGIEYEKRRQEEQQRKDMEDPENRECTFSPNILTGKRKGEDHSASRITNSSSKFQELYQQAERKQHRLDRDQDEIDYQRNQHEMRFAPEIHEVNLKGTRKPIKSKMARKVEHGLRSRMQEKLNMLDEGHFGNMDEGEDPGMIGNLQIGGSFEGQAEDGNRLHSARSNRRVAEGQVECLDMEIVIGNQAYVITIFPDSDPDALAQEFAAQNNLPQELVPQLSQEIEANFNANFVNHDD